MNSLYKDVINENYEDILNYFYSSKKINENTILYLGIALFEIGYPYEGMEYFKLADYSKYPKKIVIRAEILKALFYFSVGNYSKSCKLLTNLGDYGKDWIYLLNINQEFRIVYEDSFLRFHFEPSIIKSEAKEFIIDYKNSFQQIKKVYKPNFRKKVDIIVYSGLSDVLSNRLSYSNNFLNTIHTNLNNECGHELAHIVVASLQKEKKYLNKFINEGIAEVFNKINYVNKYDFGDLNSIIDLCDIEDYLNDIDDKKILYIGKVFFSYLYKHGNGEQFLSISKNQTKENLLNTYGKLALSAESFTLDYLKGSEVL